MPNFQDDPIQSRILASSAAAVLGESLADAGQAGPGLHGRGHAAGVVGESTASHGVVGLSSSTTGGFGVYGEATGSAVAGVSRTWVGVYGETQGTENAPAGVWGEGRGAGWGVKGHASGPGAAGVAGFHLTGQGPGLYGRGAPAGLFEGDVEVNGRLLLRGGGCAVAFGLDPGRGQGAVTPGAVMVLGPDGGLLECATAYDRRVAGVAVDMIAALPPGHQPGGQGPHCAVVLLGPAACLVDAGHGPVQAGDLLTPSPTPGHAMRLADPRRGFGALLGKAMRALPQGRGLLPILVTLQ